MSSRCSTSCGTGLRRSSTTGSRPTRSARSASAYAGDPDIYVPGVVLATGQVLVTEWMDGTPLSRIISDGSKEERDRAGVLLTRFLFSGPARAGLLHADPHPGNFRLLDDGRLGVLDFGAVDRLPDGLPPFLGRLLRVMHTGRAGHLRGRAGTARPRVPAAGHRGGPGGAARLPGAAGRAVQGGLVQVQPRVAARRGGPRRRHQYRQHHAASSTCPRPTCSSTACPRPASACCASWSAKASSGPRCCSGCRATSTIPRTYLPCHTGGRFAANARAPSLASSEANTGAMSSSIWSQRCPAGQSPPP